MTATETKTELKPVVVTTEKKGVFFGWGIPTIANEIRLEKAQMCVYWSEIVHGVLGLAATGPKKGCKISPPVPAITLNGVTSVMECTEEAVKEWEKQIWG